MKQLRIPALRWDDNIKIVLMKYGVLIGLN